MATIEHLDELRSFLPDSREAGHAAIFCDELGSIAAQASAQLADGIVVSAGRLRGNSGTPVYVMSGVPDPSPRHCLFIDRTIRSIEPMPFAVMPALVCAPNRPTRGLAVVAGIREIAIFSDAVALTEFDEEVAAVAVRSEAERLRAIYGSVFGAECLLPTIDDDGS